MERRGRSGERWEGEGEVGGSGEKRKERERWEGEGEVGRRGRGGREREKEKNTQNNSYMKD